MPIDFDMCIVFNDLSIWIVHKVTPLDLLAQVAGTLGDNRRLYSARTCRVCTINTFIHLIHGNHNLVVRRG